MVLRCRPPLPNESLDSAVKVGTAPRARPTARPQPLSDRHGQPHGGGPRDPRHDAREAVRLRPCALARASALTRNDAALRQVLDGASPQHLVFDAVRPTLDQIVEGYSGTIFAYGQTGSGKTHTMTGVLESREDAGTQRARPPRR